MTLRSLGPERSPAIIAGVLFLVLLIVLGGGVFLLLDRDPRPRSSPAPLAPSLAAANPTPTPTRRPTPPPTPRPTPSPTPTPTPTPTPVPTPVPTALASPVGTPSGPTLAGTWTVSPGSWAGYSVELLVPIFGPTFITGRTESISGGADVRQSPLGGDVIAAGQFVGDLTKLTSGDATVDRQVATMLQTDVFPTADFVLTGPVPMPASADLANGAPILLPGRITLLGKTNEVQVPATIRQTRANQLVVEARYDFNPADYGLSGRVGGGLATLGDEATFEFTVFLER